MPFPWNVRRQTPFKDDRAAFTELLTVKKQCKPFHGKEWMKEHIYALQNADTRPRLQSRTQNMCFVISISAVILPREQRSVRPGETTARRVLLFWS